MTQKTVVVGMSGGVDSSVCAYLLKKQGYRVIALFMKNWEELDARGVCSSEKDYKDVVSVCERLDIPYYSVNFVKEYQESVFSHFLKELSQGHTPNPDILCNKEIKFKAFLNKAKTLGADFLATGHYCQISPSYDLLKGNDPHKDQSYFLYTLNRDILRQVLFPVGHLPKSTVRQLAAEARLPTATKKDSTGICFIGKRDFKEFTSQYLGYHPGPMKTLSGDTVGSHDGIAFYTIGQRKGLNIGGSGEAWFVIGKNASTNTLFVEQGEHHLYRQTLTATELSWVSDTPDAFPFYCTAKIRYRSPDEECIIESMEGDTARIRFLKPQRAITPRQAIVFYKASRCLGGGLIQPEIQ